uniref:Uncharacterized protein n=1 Tax=Corvus moneduloides TaxID=1196302 RepID=A0A8U7P534_CORMO
MDIKREAEGRQPERRSGSCLRLSAPARPCPACPCPASPAGCPAARAGSSERLRAESTVGAVGTGKCLQRSLELAGAARRAAAGFSPRSGCGTARDAPTAGSPGEPRLLLPFAPDPDLETVLVPVPPRDASWSSDRRQHQVGTAPSAPPRPAGPAAAAAARLLQGPSRMSPRTSPRGDPAPTPALPGRGAALRLGSSAALHSLVTRDGGQLVLADRPHGPPITLRARYILIHDGGELHVGSERSAEGAAVEGFGQKFVGVGRGGILELHGRRRRSWTLLDRTLHPGWGSRGPDLRVPGGGTAGLLAGPLPQPPAAGRGPAAQRLPGPAVSRGDSAARSLTPETRLLLLRDRLGSSFIARLRVPHNGFKLEVSKGVILHLVDEVTSWLPDCSMHQAEEFNLLPCPECKNNQVKIDGSPLCLHVGEVIDGADMRAEVGLLTRNILIQGEMEDASYGQNRCQFSSFDTFRGHIKTLRNFSSVHMSGVELKNMGQQILGSYPVHFHLAEDVDERGGYEHPMCLDNLAIHHCFSRCVAIHGTHGLLVGDIFY